jgi:Icc protein
MTKKDNPLRVIQLSDCHVAEDPCADYRGQNADRNLSAVLTAVENWQPDLILLTGDVSEDASGPSYQRVSEKLAKTRVPVLALPGNHDDPQVMREFFSTGPWQQPHVAVAGNWRLILLDSTERRRVSGVLDQHSLDWLESELQSNADCHHLVALHHQPVEVGAPWIDKYRLESPEPFLRLVEQAASVRCVTWGHVHHDFRMRRWDVEFFSAPSTAANSLRGTDRFTHDPGGPACRWLKLWPDGQLETGLLHAQG